jgi:O-antigen/teichoic acid export membrane protein
MTKEKKDNHNFSQLLNSISIYTLSAFSNKAIPFFLLPIMTRYLTPADYGIVSLGGVIESIIIPFAGLSVSTAAVRKFFDEDVEYSKYVGNLVYIWMVSSSVIIFGFFLFSPIISDLTNFPKDWFWALVFNSIFGVVIAFSLVLLQIQNKPIAYGTLQNAKTLVNVTFAILFVVGMGWNWQGRILANVLTTGIFFAIACYLISKIKVIFQLEKTYIKHAIRFSLPLIPHVLGSLIILASDRLFLSYMIGLESVGIYSVGYSVGMIIGLLENSFNKAYMPWLFGVMKDCSELTKIKIVKITYLAFIILSGLALVLSLFAPWFLSFFVGERFSSSSQFVLWIAMGYAFVGMYKMVMKFLVFAEKTIFLSYITLFAVVINLILNYIFISQFGAIGAAQATTLTFLIKFLITWFISARVYYMPWFFWRRYPIISRKKLE